MKKETEPEEPHEVMLSITEAAGMLKCHINTIRAWVRQGKLVPVPMGAEQVDMFRKREVEALKKPLEQAGVIVLEDKHAFPVVGIGASAGGLEAVTRLLQYLPTDLGLAYVFISHMEPRQENMLADLLRKKTAIPVMVVENGMRLERDRFYVGPGAAHVSIVESTFLLQTPRGKTDQPRPIDAFFTALAAEYQNNAIGIVLSGTGTDGTEGLRAIRAEEGLAIAQDTSAKDIGMPQHAQESDVVDLVLKPEDIGKELAEIVKELYPGGRASIPRKHENELRRILKYLEEQRGVDFTQYKENTIHRRIIRRMVLSKCRKLADYSALLHGIPSELDTLYNDLLINVSSFFRDPLFHTALTKQVLPALLQGRTVNEPLRIWVAACAGGEEVVSIAITLLEYLGEQAMTTPVQIFATDLNERTIEKARLGIYKKTALQNVGAARIKQFFTHVDGHFQVIKSIRDMCVFAKHDLLKDPPFSRLDLISCQNVLIYLESAAQARILKSFHYALRPTGFLVLGKSETTANAGEIFIQPEREHKVYTKKHKGAARLNMDVKFKPTPVQAPSLAAGAHLTQANTNGLDLDRDTDKLLLNRYMPPSVLLNKDLEIVRFRGVTAPYLGPSTGKASLSLLKMVRDDLSLELRLLLQKARKEKMPVRKSGIPIQLNEGVRDIGLEVVPMGDPRDQHYLVLFKEEGISAITSTAPPDGRKWKNLRDSREKRIILLEQELREVREQMRVSAEEAEASHQELQAANEEVVSSNEELQSINEELETSKEELQSINEEFATINEELQSRNDALKESDERLRLATRTGKVGIWDWDITVDRITWSESLYELHGVKPEAFDTSIRSFMALVHADDRERVQQAIDRALKIDPRFEIEFRAVRPDGGVIWLFMNASVIRTTARPVRMMGATLDITGLKAAELSLQQRTQALELVNNVSDTLIAELDTEKIVQAVTDAGREATGAAFGAFFYNKVDEKGESYTLYTLSGAPREAFAKFPMPRATDLFGPTFRGEGVVRIDDVLKDPRYGKMAPHHGMPKGHLPVRSYLAVPVTSRDGRVLGGLFYGHSETGRFTQASEDILGTLAAQAALALDNADLYSALQHELEQQRLGTAALRESEERYRRLIDTLPAAVFTCDAEGKILLYNEACVALWGEAPNMANERSHGAYGLFTMDGKAIAPEDSPMTIAIREGRSVRDEVILQRPDGTRRNVLVHPEPLRDASGKVIGGYNVLIDITDRKISEERLRIATETGKLGIWDWDVVNDTITWTDPVFEIHGVEKGAFNPTMLGYRELIHPDDRDRVSAAIRATLEENAPYEIEFRAVNAEGKVNWVFTNAVVLREQGRPVRMMGGTMNITERKRAEEAARRLAAIVEFSEDAILSEDLQGVITSWNEGSARLYGYSTEESVGRSIMRIVPEDRQQEEAELLGRISKGERVEHFETERRRKDGTLVDVALSLSPIKDDTGTIIGASKIARDITDRKRAEDAVRKSEAKFHLLADNVAQLIWMAEADGSAMWFNKRWHEFTGMTTEEIRATTNGLHHPEHAERVRNSLKESAAKGEMWEDTFPLKSKEGRYHWFLASAMPIHDKTGAITRWFGTLTDITERKQAEEALLESAQHKDHFLATLAHELRNPLAPLKNGLQLMELSPDEPDVQEKTRAMMVRQLDHMVRLVDDLMDLSRISRGKITLVKEHVDLASIIGTAIEASRPLIERSAHLFEVHIGKEPMVVDGDTARLTQIVANLLNNAAKYTPRDGHIDLHVERIEDEAVISVKDNGIGIDPASMPRVFDMFAQVDSEQKSQAGGGLGIGLNVVQRLVWMHKGTVEGRSNGLGHGSEFIVHLPLVPSTGKAKVPETTTAVRGAAKKHRVLVVDDNQDAALSMSLILKKQGHQVEMAHDGEHALVIASTFLPEIVLMDIGMPKMNGYETCAQMRQEAWGKLIRIIALSGWGQEEDRKKSHDAGFDGHIVKPIDRATLERLVSGVPGEGPAPR